MAVLGGMVAAWPLAGRTEQVIPLLAQRPGLPRVVLLSLDFAPDSPPVQVFRNELRDLGQIDGATVAFEVIASTDLTQLASVAAAAIAMKPTVLVAVNPRAALALFRLTRDVPIVVVNTNDPLALGLTSSISRPTANITGISTSLDTLAGKRVELLHELVPTARRLGVLYELTNPNHELVLERTKAAAGALGLAVVPLGVANADDIARVPDRVVGERCDGLLVLPSPAILASSQTLISAMIKAGVPTVHSFGFEAEDGGLAAYGTDTTENWLRAAQYVDRLLRGAKISDLPFDEPTRIRLTLNLKTARALGLEIPPALLIRADEVIE
ncbi:MAG: ABC transporter substrate-binding protein [Proteobacteria bacterium]|nr:ABC transporter substrate-binding protein [Pseudomonadota bacterium]